MLRMLVAGSDGLITSRSITRKSAHLPALMLPSSFSCSTRNKYTHEEQGETHLEGSKGGVQRKALERLVTTQPLLRKPTKPEVKQNQNHNQREHANAHHPPAGHPFWSWRVMAAYSPRNGFGDSI